MITYHMQAHISDDFRLFVKNRRADCYYEKIVFSIINSSNKIFKNQPFTYVEEQANGECDYLDQLGNKYDAKLLINENQGRLMGDNRHEHEEWINDLLQEAIEFSHSIKNLDLSRVINTKLYGIMKERLASVKSDENAILFIPFPIVTDRQDFVFHQFALDFLSAVYNALDKNKLIRCRKVYYIYPSMEKNLIVLRDSDNYREYIESSDLSNIITFEMIPQ